MGAVRLDVMIMAYILCFLESCKERWKIELGRMMDDPWVEGQRWKLIWIQGEDLIT